MSERLATFARNIVDDHPSVFYIAPFAMFVLGAILGASG